MTSLGRTSGRLGQPIMQAIMMKSCQCTFHTRSAQNFLGSGEQGAAAGQFSVEGPYSMFWSGGGACQNTLSSLKLRGCIWGFGFFVCFLRKLPRHFVGNPKNQWSRSGVLKPGC